ncbi:hypothetical protein L211DRAFT_875103 [Terfezia boudieri ATCC MYA-4762]|uniref:DDE Tnp4 domain-containing protein n=1 Tax=Terfezia boudieri ATCC MYA-4762 TaxID=1051890 RepID=A0A3N4LV56_9PEZI|nr:hypothetical protein L211DRAFT_875103 [Terfezia boudieri ATCC MYA-4762]
MPGVRNKGTLHVTLPAGIIFGVSRSQISSIVSDLALFLYEKYHQKLLWDHNRLLYSQHVLGESMEIWGFIDGTVRPIARPTEDQRLYYSGHKGYHGIKYQSIMTPDGLISSLYGPEFSPKGDWKLWQESEVEQILWRVFALNPENDSEPKDVIYLYGDPAYAPSYGIRAPYRAARGGGVQEASNVVMSKYRIVRMQKVGLSPVAVNYIIAVLLWNYQTCLRQRNQISDHFGNRVRPPSLETYLS